MCLRNHVRNKRSERRTERKWEVPIGKWLRRGSFARCLLLLVLCIVLGVPVAKAQTSSESSSPTLTDTCTTHWMERHYLAYRERNRDALLATVIRAHRLVPNQTVRMLIAHPISLSREQLDCLADADDQLALYLRGYTRVMFPQATEDIVSGLGDLVRAARRRSEQSPESCRDIDANGTYYCGAGLPEAHLVLGGFFSDCGSSLWRRDIGEFHVDIAWRSWVDSAVFAQQQLHEGRRGRQRCITLLPRQLWQEQN